MEACQDWRLWSVSSTYEEGPLCPEYLARCALVAMCFDEQNGYCDANTGKFTIDEVPCDSNVAYHCRQCYPYSICGLKGHITRLHAPLVQLPTGQTTAPPTHPSSRYEERLACTRSYRGCALAAKCFDETSGLCDGKTGYSTDPASCSAVLTHCGHCFPYSMCGSKGDALRKNGLAARTTTGQTSAPSTHPSSKYEEGSVCTNEYRDCALVAKCFDETSGLCDVETGDFAADESCRAVSLYCRHCFPYSVCGSKGDALRKYSLPGQTTAVRPACPKCGIVMESGELSCCGRGAAWYKNCGDEGDSKYDHTWLEGVLACARTPTTVSDITC